MKKLRLALDEIAVESFSTMPPAARRGTVPAHDDTTGAQIICTCTDTGNQTDNFTCPDTCGNSCGGTCDASCNGTCVGCPTGGTCGNTCPDTCAVTCDGFSCPWCTNPPELVC